MIDMGSTGTYISPMRIDSGPRIGALQSSSCWPTNTLTSDPTITPTNMPST